MTKTIKTIIVDDHPIFRMGLKSILNSLEHGIEVVAEFSTSRELFNYLNSNNSLPDLVFLDIMLVGETGISIAQKLKKDFEVIKIMMLSSEVNENTINEILEVGVNAYLSKLASKKDIGRAIETVMDGENYFGASVSKMMHQVYLFNKQKPQNNMTSSLTERETDLLKDICEGYTAKDIAEKHDISKRTVETHKSNIMRKLGFKNNLELIKFAIKKGIVSLD